jgi:hypothetical protein
MALLMHRHRIMDITGDFQSSDRGSIPRGDTRSGVLGTDEIPTLVLVGSIPTPGAVTMVKWYHSRLCPYGRGFDSH